MAISDQFMFNIGYKSIDYWSDWGIFDRLLILVSLLMSMW